MNLGDARLYLAAPARLAAGALADLVPELVDAGVDVVQLREKEMEGGDLMRVGAPVAEACRSARIPFIVNDRPDVAFALGADGVHLGTNDLPLSVARMILPNGLVGLSTHSPDDIESAVGQGPDYIGVGPVHETPTKPGRPGTGLGLVQDAAERVPDVPWFVTGGMNEDTIPEVLAVGGRRVVVVRAITEADDPASAAANLKKMLLEVTI